MNNATLTRRIELLERRTGGSPVVLHLADGSVRQLPGTSRHYHKLCALLDADTECAELEWVKTAIRIDEPGHVYELLACLLRGANDEGSEDEVK